MKTTKKLLTLLLSLAIMVTFMPITAMTAWADGVQAEDGSMYSAELFINGEANSVEITPGESVELEVKLFHRYDKNDRLVTEEVFNNAEFEVLAEENDAFIGEDQQHQDIVTIEPIEGELNRFTCSAKKIPFGEGLADGHAELRAIAFYDVNGDSNPEEIACDWTVGIDVRTNIVYGNTAIYSEGGDDKYLNVVLSEIGDAGITINPYCPSKDDLSYDFHIHNEEWLNPDYDEDVTGDENVLTISKAKVEQIIEGRGTAFEVWVKAFDGDTTYKNERVWVMVDDGLTDIFGEYYIEYPSAVKYKPENTDNIYDIEDQFVLKKKSDNSVVTAGTEFEWRFVEEDPNTLNSKESSDAASVKVDGGLLLDHFGTYWVVAAGLGDGGYKGFHIGAFELTDEDNFYTKKPVALEELYYDDGNDIELVTAGTASNGGIIQYKLDNGTYETSIPTAKTPGDYKVSFRIVDSSGNVLVPEETVDVKVRKKVINLKLKDIKKTYGEMDPEFSFENLVDTTSSDEGADSFADDIHFTRERGEDVGEYRIFARCTAENYDAIVTDGKLTINKANYYISVADTVSFDYDGGSCFVPYNTNAESIKVERKLGDASKLRAVAKDGNLILQASGATNETIKLIASDDNHNKAEASISIVSTKKGIETDSESVGGASVLGESTLPEGADHLSVESDGDDSFNIELQNLSGNKVEVNGNSIIVKVKLSDDVLEGFEEKTNLKACFEEETHNAWIELIDGYYYICFETNHLSKWTFTGNDPISLKGAEFVLPEDLKAIEIGYDEEQDTVFYQDLNMGDEVLKIDDIKVPKNCFNLRFAYLEGEEDAEYEFDRDRINEPGWYKVKAEAITGMGYVGEVEFADPIEVSGPDEHDFDYENWESNKEYHWHTCTKDDCAEMADYGAHIFDREIATEEYLFSDATCTSPAKYYKSCECGERGDELFSVEGETAKGHDKKLTYVEVAPASEVSTGWKAHYQCKSCGACFIKNGNEYNEATIEELIIANHTHSGETLVHVHEKAATATTPGNLEYWYCATCNACFKDANATQLYKNGEWIIPATGGGGDPTPGPIPTPGSDEEKFVESKTAATADCDALLEQYKDDEYPYIAKLVDEAKKTIEATTFDKTKTLAQNEDVITAIVDKLKTDAAAQKALDDKSSATAVKVAKVKVTQKALKTYKSHKVKVTFKRVKAAGKYVTSYQIYRKTGKNGTYKKVKTVTAKKSTVTFTNKKLKKGKTYYYKVRGVVTLPNTSKAYTKWSTVKKIKCK